MLINIFKHDVYSLDFGARTTFFEIQTNGMEKTHWKEHWMGLQSTSPRGVNTKMLTNVSPGTCFLIFQRQEMAWVSISPNVLGRT